MYLCFTTNVHGTIQTESAVQGRGRAGLWADDKQVVEVEQAIMPYPMLLQFPPVQI